MATKDIAQLADVSISIMSKIANNKGEDINPETRNRVLKIAKDYNYVPYSSVKSTSEAKTSVPEVLLRYISRINLFLNGMIPVAQAEGYSMVMHDSNEDIEHKLEDIISLRKNRVDGVVWEPVCEQSPEYRRYFDEQNIEICLVNATEKQSCYFIGFEEIGYQATQVLLDYHHRKLGCLTKEDNQRSRVVLEGFRRCPFDNNILFSEDIKLPMESSEWYNRILSHVPTDIVSSHYASSMILMEQPGKFKFRAPCDLSLVSLRDDVREDIRFPGISSVKIPYYEFGNFVCGRLIRQCEKQETLDEPFRVECPLEDTFSLRAPFSSHTKRVVVVRSISADMTLNANELPQPGKTTGTNKHSVIPSDKGVNQSVGVAKLEDEVALIGRVDDDCGPILAYACMEGHHVDIQGIRRDTRAETGKAYIHVQDDGEGMTAVLAGANQNLPPADVNHYEDLFEHSEYCPLQTEVPEAAMLEAAKQAHKCRVENILKPAAIDQINYSLMQYIDIFVPNRREAEILCPEEPDIGSKAEAFQATGARTVIITLGYHGYYIKGGSLCGCLPAAGFVPADITGVIDAFIAMLTVCLLNDHFLVNAAKIATYMAGFYVSRQGVVPAMINRNSLETYTARREPELVSTHSYLMRKTIDTKDPESETFPQARDLL